MFRKRNSYKGGHNYCLPCFTKTEFYFRKLFNEPIGKLADNKGPEYYKRGPIDTWDFIRQQELGYHLGNVIKYVCRAGHKGDAIEDLEKAIHYLENEIENRRAAQPDS